MSGSEFQLINHYFSRLGVDRTDVLLGVGDDCALLQVPEGQVLAVSIDTLVEGVHFFPGVDPESLGHKALAVNLSDLAAMGADPAWITLALTLPRVDEQWLAAFSSGFAALAKRFQLQLVGGDTTRGPLTISVQVHGFVASGKALRRDRAKPGDLIYVSGTLGDAGLALLAQKGAYDPGADLAALQIRLDRPEPRIGTSQSVRDLATGAIDISDGLLADLGHICEQSRVGAVINLSNIPLSDPVRVYVEKQQDWTIPLSAGDDYELCLIVPARHQAEIEARAQGLDVGLSLIGQIEVGETICCLDENGTQIQIGSGGYDHFPSS